MSTEDATERAKGVSLTQQGEGIHVLTLLPDGEKPFILTEANIAALERVVQQLEHDHHVRALVIHATHPKVFCAGADVETLANVGDSSTAQRLSRRGQDLFNRIDDFHFPTIACIHGTCVGGGFELALSCDVRLASDHPSTRIGLPEVQLGILPAWGGTTRLPLLVGLPTALDLLLTGKTSDGKKAAKLGLVNTCVPHGLLLECGLKEAQQRVFAHEHGDHGGGTTRSIGVLDYFSENTDWGKRLVLSRARAAVMAKTKGRMPAPLEIVATLGLAFGKAREESLWREREALGRLVESKEAKHLAAIFTRNRDKYRGKPYDIVLSGDSEVRRVAVVGAGVMGAGIAAAFMEKGIDVRLIDPFPKALANARAAIEKDFIGGKPEAIVDRYAISRMMARLQVSTEYTGIASQDLVIEAVPEVMNLKHEALSKLSALVPAGALVTTNTSSLSLAEMERSVRHPERFAGLHFFNPARKMPLVEIVRAPATSDETLARLVHVTRLIGKTPVVVADLPAFVVNRLLAPYFLDAIRLLHAGEDVADIDRAMKAFGFPMGPFEVMDTVGLDVVKHVCDYLSAFPARRIKGDPIIDRLVERKRLGKKAAWGFYMWEGKKPAPYGFDEVVTNEHRPMKFAAGRLGMERIQKRLLHALESEALQILHEKGVISEDDLDLASIYGMGFPPETGGIATWIREKGLAK